MHDTTNPQSCQVSLKVCKALTLLSRLQLRLYSSVNTAVTIWCYVSRWLQSSQLRMTAPVTLYFHTLQMLVEFNANISWSYNSWTILSHKSMNIFVSTIYTNSFEDQLNAQGNTISSWRFASSNDTETFSLEKSPWFILEADIWFRALVDGVGLTFSFILA